MGSICTQTDFVDLAGINDYNVQIFLCLVKDNEASTQCSLHSDPHKQEMFERKKKKRHSSMKNDPTIVSKDWDRNLHQVFLINEEELKDKKCNDDNEDPYLTLKQENKKNCKTQDLFCELEISCDLVNNENMYISRKRTKPINTDEIGKIETDTPSIESTFLNNITKISENNCGLKMQKNIDVFQNKNTKSMISLNVKKIVTTNPKNKYKRESAKKTRRRLVGPFKCDKCDIEFELFSPYSRHLSSHQKTDGKCCKICNKILSSEISLKRHMLIHTGKPFICEVCGKGFTGHYMLRDHLLNQHKQPTTKWELQTYFQCSSCKSFLASSGALAYHQAREHTCKLCQGKWPCRTSLRDHIMTDHDNIQKNDNGQIVCSFCDQTFLYRHSYINHIAKHNGEKNYECVICDKKCSTKTSLQFHIKQVHEKYNYRHSCSYCNKRFICKAKLIEHERIHTGEKPFSCSLCNLSFAAKATYNNHVKLVHNGTPKLKSKKQIEQSVVACNYECPLCNVKKISITELEAHCLELHNASVEFLSEVNNDMVKVYTF